MEIEIYRKQNAVQVPVVEPEEERLALYQTLGFKGLEELSTRIDPADWYPELSSFQHSTWVRFLPTGYASKNRTYFMERHDWNEYCFDKIPLPVLKEFETAQNLGFFHKIVIRTPERGQIDPAAIGYTRMPDGNIRQFLIARWGESLIPYWQVFLRAWWPLCMVLGVASLIVLTFLVLLACALMGR